MAYYTATYTNNGCASQDIVTASNLMHAHRIAEWRAIQQGLQLIGIAQSSKDEIQTLSHQEYEEDQS